MSSLSSSRWLLPSTEVVTVGLPFCVFKLLTGGILVATPGLAALGYPLLALGAVDSALNVGNLLALLTVHRRLGAVCLTDVVVGAVGRGAADHELGLALDVFLSFSLVAIVLGFGLLSQLPGWALAMWNLAVVLNVLGAGVGRLLAAMRRASVGERTRQFG